jgi:hypothetical protein
VTAAGTGSFGAMKINNYNLPLFNNGSVTAQTKIVIPIQFVSSNYNFVEIKMSFLVSALADIALGGWTTSGGGGSSVGIAENGESFTPMNSTQVSTYYATSGTVKPALDVIAYNVYHQFTMTISKSNPTDTQSTRNHYTFQTTYSRNGYGTTRVIGSGHYNTPTLGSRILTPSTGTTSATWSTVHYY